MFLSIIIPSKDHVATPVRNSFVKPIPDNKQGNCCTNLQQSKRASPYLNIASLSTRLRELFQQNFFKQFQSVQLHASKCTNLNRACGEFSMKSHLLKSPFSHQPALSARWQKASQNKLRQRHTRRTNARAHTQAALFSETKQTRERKVIVHLLRPYHAHNATTTAAATAGVVTKTNIYHCGQIWASACARARAWSSY